MDQADVLAFLPSWPPAIGPLGWFAILLLIAAAAGESVARLLRLPRLLGWVLAGMLLGPHALGVLGRGALDDLRLVIDVALGLLLFELGHRLDLAWLRRNPWLLATGVLECALSFVAVYAALRAFSIEPLYAAATAAIAMSTSPAVVIQVTRELRAQGQVTERMLLLTALNSLCAVVALTVWLGWMHLEYREDPLTIVLHPLYVLAGSLLLAAAATGCARLLPRAFGGREEVELLLPLGLVVLLIAAALAADVSVLLALLSFGALARHMVPGMRVLPRLFASTTSIMAVPLFALVGAQLDLRGVLAGGAAALAIVAARAAAKCAVTLATARPSGISAGKGFWLGLSLTPMSGLALALVLDTSEIYPSLRADLLVVVLAAVTILELLGPVLTRLALVRAREAHEPQD
jgi:Kef-type K+ transport system membrane component KefB